MFQLVYDVKSVPQPDSVALLGINYCLQIIETGFAEWLMPLTGWSLRRFC
jgi:hypothetical protein